MSNIFLTKKFLSVNNNSSTNHNKSNTNNKLKVIETH